MSFTYLGLRGRLETVEVTEEEIDRQLLRLQQNAPRLTPVTDRPAVMGDEVLLDYAGFCGDEQFEGGTAQKQVLALGSHTFIPGFEEQLVGANAGDDVTVKVTFPAEYHAPQLAGKDAEFRCHIHAIRTRSSYEMDDTFAKEVGGVETLEQMKEKLGGELRRYYADRAEAELQDRLLRQAAATVEGEFTPQEEAAAVEAQMQTLEAQLSRRGLTLEAYCQFTNQTPEQVRADARPEAMEQLRMHRAVETVAALEGIKPTQEEYDEQLKAICEENRMTMEELQPYMDDAFRQAVENSILTGRVMAFLREHAVIENA